MVYTDGEFHDERLVRRQIDNLKRRGVRVVIVGLGRDSRKSKAKSLLESIASTRSDVYLVDLKRPSLWVEEELNEVAQHVISLQCENLYPGKLPQRQRYNILKNSLIIHEENTKKNHKRVVSVYVIQIHVDLHKLSA